MTDRKFTPPMEFPAEYVTSDGRKAVILGEMPQPEYPFFGYIQHQYDSCGAFFDWKSDGSCYGLTSQLHDLPKKQVRWANDYYDLNGWSGWFDTREEADDSAMHKRVAMIRREWIEGQPPQYFVEDVNIKGEV